MARRKINTMLKTPDGVFNALRADVVTPTDKGVAILGANGNLMCWIEVQDPDLRREISHLVSDRVYTAQIGENIDPIDWAGYGLAVGGKPVQSDKAAASKNEMESDAQTSETETAVEHDTAL